MYSFSRISGNPTDYMEQSFYSWDNNRFSAGQENHSICGAQYCVIVFTGGSHGSLFWARWIQSIFSHRISLRSFFNIIVTYTPSLSADLFSPVFPIRTLKHLCFPPPTLFVLIWSPRSYMMGSTDRESHLYAISFLLSYFLPLRSKYFLQLPILERSLCSSHSSRD